jgi:hypothetical protein
VSVRASQGALPGLGQEHQPVAGDFSAVEFVDGAQTNNVRDAGMSAPAAWSKVQKRAPRGKKHGELARQRCF